VTPRTVTLEEDEIVEACALNELTKDYMISMSSKALFRMIHIANTFDGEELPSDRNRPDPDENEGADLLRAPLQPSGSAL